MTISLPSMNRRSLLTIGAWGAAASAVRLPAAASSAAPLPPTTTLTLGMSTEWNRWNERAALTGPVSLRRCYAPSWNVPSLVRKVEACLDLGLVPYASMKFGASWDSAASGAMDAKFRELASALSGLDSRVRLTFHHEPRGEGVSTPQQLVAWGRANTRAYRVMRDVGVPKVILGPTDNGFPWSAKRGQQLSDADLRVYYTPEFLGVCDALGADFYDGSTAATRGEPAHVKMRNFAAWAGRIGFGGVLDVGEWNFVGAADVTPTLQVLRLDPRWWAAALFNSAANNRDDLPRELNGSWELRPRTARLAEFREMLDTVEPDRRDG